MSKINFQNVHTMVGADAKINGPIELTEGIIIYGKVIGDVVSSGPVRIAQGAVVEGNIIGSDIRLGGHVIGNLQTSGQVVLGSKSQLSGDITYRKLLIEDGAKFEGKCDLIDSGQVSNS